MVRIMTDNAANLPKALLEQYGIGELCLTYTVDGEPADTAAEFDGRSFYDAMRRGAVVQTSMVTPDAARQGMEPHLVNGDDVLYVGLSGGVSGTCWGVGLVARELAEQYPERKIRVLDSRGASLGEGLIVLEAARLAAEGRVLEEIVVRCEELCGKMRQHFMVDDLKFLRKGGRISGSAALAGTLLQIKPILQGDEDARRSEGGGQKRSRGHLPRRFSGGRAACGHPAAAGGLHRRDPHRVPRAGDRRPCGPGHAGGLFLQRDVEMTP